MLVARLLTAIAALGAASAAGTRTTARYSLTDEPRSEHELLTKQLEALGIERFVPANQNPGEQDALHRWQQLLSTDRSVDLVWSLDAYPPFEKLRFSKAFRTKVNHLPGASRLTTGDQFYQHMSELQHTKEKFFFDFVPSYHVLPRDAGKMPQLFADALKKVEFEMKRERDWFIYQRFLVRALPNSGNDDALTPATAVVSQQELDDTINAQFKGKDVEVTQYIEPYLLDGHKFQVGFYVAILSLDPLRIYVYNHAQIKIAKTPYPTKLEVGSDASAYNFKEYTAPWDFPELQKLFREYPSAKRAGSNAWSIVKRYMSLKGTDTRRLQREIDDAIVKTITSNRGYLQSQIGKLERFQAEGEASAEPTNLDESFFELLRFDFEVEDTAKPWLVKVHSNPSISAHTSVFGTDEAIKKGVLFDLLNLVGVHPQAKPTFDAFFGSTNDKFCADKCADKSRVWDTACWACPGWFPKHMARRLYDASSEYARRGEFKLLYPSQSTDYSQFFDNALTEYDQAFNRYIKSFSASYAEKQDSQVSDKALVCVYREHCSGHGDCINGKCSCDDDYEGATCYIPRDRTSDKAAPEATRESWRERMGNLWNGAAKNGDGAMAAAAQHEGRFPRVDAPPEGGSLASLVGGLVVVGGVLGLAYRMNVLQFRSVDSLKAN
ncbi:hypothetical protein ATCC90586_004870 [Pythium insidiosum]|nr:hypothetical protein ATCC90586_004870 [Pythium insidiosum]